MASSPPASPSATHARPPSTMSQSMEAALKARPQSAIMRPPRSTSRLSQSSGSRVVARAPEDESKTSVKVVVRVRPPLGPTDPGFDLIPQRFQKSMISVTTPTSLGVDSPQGRKIFIFDRVFDGETSQGGVWDYVQDSVDSFLQGYNVSILAYGQSGSGKSFTMGTSGPAQQFEPSSKGVIPRAAAHLFESLSDEKQMPNHIKPNSGIKAPARYSTGNLAVLTSRAAADRGSEKEWEMSVTYVEIYNEQPRDLLLPEATPIQERPNVQIREDTKGRIFVEGLKTVPVNSIDELMTVLNHGSSIRQTDATAINSKSSRSHAIFTINLRQHKQVPPTTLRDKRASTAEALTPADGTTVVESKLHFVDLAGSERLKNTGATGDRAKEGININAGLASLGKVISQLSSRAGGGHVSYRDSKLTRILQDSLGGNAITYMIACVTPAEFHLSETLNTVQYAQRARNIQSKPKIQHINDDTDKQVVIERLKSEIAFLRQQVRGAESGERRAVGSSDRLNEREAELQNQLLDVQESYNTLNQRHAKLISELAKTGDGEDETQSLGGESSSERLKRSQENQQQIESVVMEYEKTIQSLETNLQVTRSSLATTESNLLEKETKCAFIETMNQQLNSRIQKLMDRESNTESYLHELESRLEDHTTGEEKHDALVSELRKEMTRIRESETNAEDYICTLEERLAEADQDMEILQREVERLEQLVNRQRSLTKLDNLLYELDHVQKKAKAPVDQTPSRDMNGTTTETGPETPARLQPSNGVHVAENAAVVAADLTVAPGDSDATVDSEAASGELSATKSLDQLEEELQPSPAQQRFVAEKFESVSQELFDLKIEHESTVNELDLMSAKYQEALRTLAEMQDGYHDGVHPMPSRNTQSPELPSRPTTSGQDGKDLDDKADDQPGSRSLSSALSVADESVASTDPPEVTALPTSRMLPLHIPDSGTQSPDIEHLQSVIAEHERSMKHASEKYTQLRSEHDDTLKTVEKLRTEMRLSASKDQPSSPGGITSPSLPAVIRRMTSNINSGVDRGQRSLVTLRTLLAEELDGKTEFLEKAESHLTAAGHEMTSRQERIQKLENEIKGVRKEMETKTTIIAGLTRERTSMRAGTPVDLSMVSQMRDQLIQKETELKSLHEGYAKREEELQVEIQRLTAESKSRVSSPDPAASAEKEEKLESLREELAAAEQKLATTATELDAARATAETLKSRQGSPVEPNHDAHSDTNHEDTMAKLKEELASQILTNKINADKIAELTKSHAASAEDIVVHQRAIMVRNTEIDQHKAKIAELEAKMDSTQSGANTQRNSLRALHEKHANEVEEMKLSHAGILATYDDKFEEISMEHQKTLKELNDEIEDAKAALNQIINGASIALGHPTSQESLVSHISDLLQEKESIVKAKARLIDQNFSLERQLEGRQSLAELEEAVEATEKKLGNYQETIRSLANEVGNHEETIRDKEKIIKKHVDTIESISAENQKRIAQIEELEQQLQSSYEQHHNRVSVIQNQGNQALVEAQQRISVLEKEVQRSSMNGSDEAGSRSNTMNLQIRPQSPANNGAQRSDSMNSNLRKSASIASLPSPPPAIPLPPLPSLPGISLVSSNPSPPQSRHTSKEVAVAPATTNGHASSGKDNSTIRRQSAIIEDQEGRIRTIEKHLQAEKQLTSTLEEALVDLETQSNKLRVDAESWKKKAWAMEEELSSVRKERRSERLSVQAVEEEVKKRREAEAARAQLEERMKLLQGDGQKKKKKGGGLNCF